MKQLIFSETGFPVGYGNSTGRLPPGPPRSRQRQAYELRVARWCRWLPRTFGPPYLGKIVVGERFACQGTLEQSVEQQPGAA